MILYLESFGNPRKFARIAPHVARRKPVLAMKSGRSDAGVRAAGSHTAALAGSDGAADALFREERRKEDELLATDKYAKNVGAFEGANYEPHGNYRPQENCIMFTRHDSFCAVCRRAIERIISMYALSN